MTYRVDYLELKSKRFYKKKKAEEFIRKQYKILRFFEMKKDGTNELLWAPVPMSRPAGIKEVKDNESV